MLPQEQQCALRALQFPFHFLLYLKKTLPLEAPAAATSAATVDSPEFSAA